MLVLCGDEQAYPGSTLSHSGAFYKSRRYPVDSWVLWMGLIPAWNNQATGRNFYSCLILTSYSCSILQQHYSSCSRVQERSLINFDEIHRVLQDPWW